MERDTSPPDNWVRCHSRNRFRGSDEWLHPRACSLACRSNWRRRLPPACQTKPVPCSSRQPGSGSGKSPLRALEDMLGRHVTRIHRRDKLTRTRCFPQCTCTGWLSGQGEGCSGHRALESLCHGARQAGNTGPLGKWVRRCSRFPLQGIDGWSIQRVYSFACTCSSPLHRTQVCPLEPDSCWGPWPD